MESFENCEVCDLVSVDPFDESKSLVSERQSWGCETVVEIEYVLIMVQWEDISGCKEG